LPILGFSDADGMFESCGSSSQAKDLKLGAWMISTQVLLSCPRMVAHLHSKLRHISLVIRQHRIHAKTIINRLVNIMCEIVAVKRTRTHSNVWRITMLHRPIFLHITFLLVLPKSSYNAHFHIHINPKSPRYRIMQGDWI
jgi:hypothetical protein